MKLHKDFYPIVASLDDDVEQLDILGSCLVIQNMTWAQTKPFVLDTYLKATLNKKEKN